MMLNSVGAVMIAAAFLLCAGCGQAQIQADHSFADTCDMSTLFARVDSLASECDCGTSDCDSDSSSSCPTNCLSALLPLLDDCHDMINRVFDGDDGVLDGEASIFSEQYNQCAAMPPAALIDELKALQDRGQCPPTVLDRVAATEVKAPGCADLWDGDRCSLSIASGIMTCEHDFCTTVYPPCVMAGQCDRSCNLCGDDGGSGHRRLLAILRQLRQLQMSHMACDPATFSSEAATVDAACCDGEQGCVDGIPGECDAKCAVVFNSFYPRCQRFLASQFSIAEMAGYDQLFSTCTRALPAEPLLRALVACSANPPDLCIEVDCGEHGSCDGGACQCEQGYSGETCDVFDPCAEIDCGEHGSCDGGTCQCEARWSGESCQVDPCFEVDCGEHGNCVGGSCQCEDHYSGQRCEVVVLPCCTLTIACGPSNVHPCAGYDGSCGCAGECLGSCARSCDGYDWCDRHVHGWDSVCDRTC